MAEEGFQEEPKPGKVDPADDKPSETQAEAKDSAANTKKDEQIEQKAQKAERPSPVPPPGSTATKYVKMENGDHEKALAKYLATFSNGPTSGRGAGVGNGTHTWAPTH